MVELRDIFFQAGARMILDACSLVVRPHEIHALLGTNGVGKSTLAYIIMGCEGYQPNTGEILFRSEVINHLGISERARLGITMTWQEPVRFEGISVRDYISLRNPSCDGAYYLRLVGLDPSWYLQRMVDRCLSGGERKRIELASALALHPQFAVLDEPDSGIDMLSFDDIVHVIRLFRENGASVLLITHRPELALIADAASQLCGGRIVCTGSPQEVTDFFMAKKCAVCAEVNCNA
ncbi:MAG TPA: ATP-binding cassette domain-containing protein [Dissulfurispiraceae bacterium]|nr:ATP-binding cassette domain-containing protein [Dissulfurispiraceae bacterium]